MTPTVGKDKLGTFKGIVVLRLIKITRWNLREKLFCSCTDLRLQQNWDPKKGFLQGKTEIAPVSERDKSGGNPGTESDCEIRKLKSIRRLVEPRDLTVSSCSFISLSLKILRLSSFSATRFYPRFYPSGQILTKWSALFISWQQIQISINDNLTESGTKLFCEI